MRGRAPALPLHRPCRCQPRRAPPPLTEAGAVTAATRAPLPVECFTPMDVDDEEELEELTEEELADFSAETKTTRSSMTPSLLAAL